LDSGLPIVGEDFDMWLPTSVNISKMKWSSGLVQDVDKLQSSSGSSLSGFPKVENTLASANEADGTTAFDTIDLSLLLSPLTTVLGFINGIEVSVELGDPATAGADVDIVVDITSVGYPSFTDIYWHGSGTGGTPSTLGDAQSGDVIRLYYLSS